MTDSVGTDISLRGGGKNRRRSWRRRVKLVTAAVVAVSSLMWFVPWAYLRMTTPPARSHDDYSDLFACCDSSDDDDATAEWMTALAAIPAQPTFDEPPPAGMKWKFKSGLAPFVGPSQIHAGRWDPASRPSLRVVIRYVSSAKMTLALERIVALRNRPWKFDPGFGGTPNGSAKVSAAKVRQLAQILVARSRLRSETGDDAGGWEDLKSVLAICRTAPRDTSHGRSAISLIESSAVYELRFYLRTTGIDEGLAGEIERVLNSFPKPDQVWREAMAGELCLGLHEIDSCFSDDGNGNGWLVLSSQPDPKTAWPFAGPAAATKRSNFWNLLSPLYHDRRTATKRLNDCFAARVAASDLPYHDGNARLRAVDLRGTFASSDGPWLHFLGRQNKVLGDYQDTIRSFASRKATRIMTALSWFRGERGHFPARLEELAPRYVSSLPVDPFCGASFGYERVDGDDYVLYSCGTDGDKDDSPATDRWRKPLTFGRDGDDYYTLPRSDSYSQQPIAVPIERASDGPTSTDEDGP